jgi:flagellar L-ring protein precursor FlgH
VTVTDVLPNGNLVIEGVRVVSFSGETQYVVLRGIVRRDDIARDNSVVSTNIADARVEFHSEGSLTDAQKRGWLARIYERLRPL